MVGYGIHTDERFQESNASWKVASSNPEALSVEYSSSWKQLHPIFIMTILEDSSFRSQGLRQTRGLRYNMRKILSKSSTKWALDISPRTFATWCLCQT